jgi:hypothetical protein
VQTLYAVVMTHIDISFAVDSSIKSPPEASIYRGKSVNQNSDMYLRSVASASLGAVV